MRIFYAGLLALLLALLCPGAAARPSIMTIDLAEVVVADTPSFPLARAPADGAPRYRALPDDWVDWRSDNDMTAVWYRVRFVAPATGSDLLALYLARVCSAFELQLNGIALTRRGRVGGASGLPCERPQVVVLPRTLVRAGSNTLDLRVVGEPRAHVASRERSGGLSALQLGPLAPLAARAENVTLWQVTLPQAAGATLLLMGGFMVVLGWRERRISYLAYFGALAIGWALLEARRWAPQLPPSDAVAEFLFSALLAFVTLAAVQFLLRYARIRDARVGRWLAIQCALMPLSLVLAGTARLNLLTAAWAALFACEIAAAAVLHLRQRHRASGRWPWPPSVLLGAVGVALAIDVVARQLALPGLLVHVSQLAVPLALVIVGLRLVQRQGQALQASEASRLSLEARVREATAEIERNFRQLSELKVEQVTERERKRIAADLHDDLGAKLLTIVHTTEEQRIATLAREALEEMRLSVRGLTGKPVRLSDALGDWRAELMARIDQAGIEGAWASPDDLPQTLSARAYVQTTRILREATSNIIKHSGASRCSIECSIEGADLLLLIQDNGAGIPMELDGRLDRGHGMASMKSRAKQMHGQCLVESGPGYGTVIRLTLPLERATETAA